MSLKYCAKDVYLKKNSKIYLIHFLKNQVVNFFNHILTVLIILIPIIIENILICFIKINIFIYINYKNIILK
jgi:hypothetical protein